MKIITLEIGSSAVKLGAASFDPTAGPDAPVTMLAVEEEPLLNCVRYGRIQNVEDVKKQTLMALSRLSCRPELEGAEITGVYAAVGGRSLGSLRTRARLTLPDERLITDDLIERLKNDALAEVPQGTEVLDICPLQYTVNDVATPRPVGAYGNIISGEFTVVTCAPLNIRNIERVVTERLNLDVCGYIVRPLAIGSAALSIEDTNAGCMLVDCGAETTTVTIYMHGAPVYIATIPIGSRNITRDLSAGLALTEDKAEEIKLRVGNAMPDGIPGNTRQIEIDSYVQARAYEIVANIVAYIGFAGLQPADLRAGIFVTGGGARLRNFCNLLRMHSGCEVRMATLRTQVHIADPSINPQDNLDLIAVTIEACRVYMSDETIPDCVAAPQSEPEPEPEPEPEQTADKPQETELSEYSEGSEISDFSDDDDDDDEGDRHVDDEDVLVDDDEAERRREAREDKIRRDKARREMEQAKNANRQRNENVITGFWNRAGRSLGKLATDIFKDSSEGKDLDD